MNFLEFKQQFGQQGCFNVHQIYAWQPDFNKNNLTRWIEKDFLLKLRNGFYSFPEYLDKPGFQWLIANCIYRPSYVSLHSALAFYGMIPESVVQVTSITTLKTHTFKNKFGEFSYKKVSEHILFGYEYKPLADGMQVRFAQPEKALLDLLYLYPFYATENELKGLRLDEDFIQHELNREVLEQFLIRFESKALERRVNSLFNIFSL